MGALIKTIILFAAPLFLVIGAYLCHLKGYVLAAHLFTAAACLVAGGVAVMCYLLKDFKM